MFNFVRIRVKLWGARGSNPMLQAVAPSLTLKTNKRASRRDNMTKDEEIKKLKEDIKLLKWKEKNSVMICGFSSDDDADGERAKELGVGDGETFFDFDEEGFIEDALYQLKCELKYDRVFRNGDEE